MKKEILDERNMNREPKKTNIPILDQNIWNWLKNKKNQYNLESIADFIFKILDYNRENNRFEKEIILKNLEKYFEYKYYTMEELIQSLNFSQENVIKLINEFIGKEIPLFGTGSKDQIKNARKKIHALMVDNDIIPRELSIAYKIQKYMLQKFPLQIPAQFEIPNEVLFGIFYPNLENRRLEIYTFTSNLLLSYLEGNKNENFGEVKCEICKKSDSCIFQRPDFLYLQAGLKEEFEEIKEDFIAETIKEYTTSKYLNIYGLFLQSAMDRLLQLNLGLVQQFLAEEIFHVDEKTLEIIHKIDRVIDDKVKQSNQSFENYGIPVPST